MAKKKLFGNRKEPCCETCSHGKLSASGDTVLCIRGGALPLTHHCRHYVYDPLRRTPKRRPLPPEFDAQAFTLDEQPQSTTVVPAATDSPATLPSVADRSTFDHLFEYLNTHETPDAQTILDILNRSAAKDPEESLDDDTLADDTLADDTLDDDTLDDDTLADSTLDDASLTDDPIVTDTDAPPAIPAEPPALSPDDSPDIEGDLQRLNMDKVPHFATLPLQTTDMSDPIILTAAPPEDLVFLTSDEDDDDAPLSADDLVFLPKGTPSDHDSAEHVGGGFTPLTGNE